MPRIGVLLIVAGAVQIVACDLTLLEPKSPYLGRLPGDNQLRRGNFEFRFPLVTCIVISLLLSLVLGVFLCR